MSNKIIKNSADFQDAVLAHLSSIVKTDNGFVSIKGKFIESAKGGVNFQSVDKVVKSFLDKLRNDIRKDSEKDLTFLELCRRINEKENMNQVLTFYYNGKKEKVVVTDETRQTRLNAFSDRIVKAYSELIGFKPVNDNKLVLSNVAMLAILKATAGFYLANTVTYVKKAKKEKATETTAPVTDKPAFNVWLKDRFGMEFDKTPKPALDAMAAQYHQEYGTK